MNQFATIRFLMLVTCACIPATAWGEQAEIEFFEKKIRPVLVEHCYKCHSEESAAVKGGLVLDHRDGLIAGGDSGPALEPGNAADSLLLSSLKYETYEMPPAGKLPDAVIRDFETWIANGAIDPRKAPVGARKSKQIDWEAARQFWSFRPLPDNPYDKDLKLSVRTERINQLIARSLEAAQITPNPASPPEKRIRRLYYDLTGLPPDPEQILEFVNDPTPDRWAATVDRLLQSQQFGEKWGRHWLDVVRYADSNGGDFNATYKNAWKFRDYVISSFNADKPIDQFFQEQIAGDLLPATDTQTRRDQIVATGFLMIGPKMLSERDKEKLHYDVIDEQIDSFGKAFLGLSLGCARCHDHKFDPVPTADYYALAGIFGGAQVLNGESQQYVSDWLRRDLPTSPEHQAALQKYQQQLKEIDGQIKVQKKNVAQHEATVKQLRGNPNALTIDNKQAKLIGDWKSSTFSKPYFGADYVHDNKQGQGEKRAVFTATLDEAGKYEVLVSYAGTSGRDNRVPVTISHADVTTEKFVDQTKSPKVDGMFASLGQFEYPANAQITVTISNTGTTGYVIVDAVRFSRVDAVPTDNPNAEQLVAAEQQLKQDRKQLGELERARKQLVAAAPAPVPQAIATQDRDVCQDCNIMIRGEHTNPGQTVPRGTLKIINGEQATLEIESGSGRKELAAWLVTEARSMSSRVYVNRVWSHLLGSGLVASVDNFGIQGIPPTHPELLDELALQFTATEWSTKQLIRSIVLSDVYQRSTVHQADAYKKDPANRLLWQANRRPLTAEEMRDTFLVLRQQLDETFGGSTVSHLGRLVVTNNPGKPTGAGTADHQVRRAVYQPVLRSQLDDIAFLFDFANPEMVVGKRPTTNVPAQALFLLNHPQTRKTAQQLVERGFEKHGEGSFSVLPDLYLEIYGRLPNRKDDLTLQNYVRQQLGDDVEPQQIRDVWTDVVQALLISTEFRYLD